LKVPKNIGKHNDWVQSILFWQTPEKKSFIGKKSYTRVKNFLLQDEKLEQGGKTGFGVEFECPRRKQQTQTQTQTQTQMSWIPHPHKVC